MVPTLRSDERSPSPPNTPGWVRRGAKALATTGDAVLLVREAHADGSTFWTLPGGGIRGTEPPAAGLRRELREELRCEVVVDGPVGRVWYAHRSRNGTLSAYDVYDCTVTTPVAPNAAEGVRDARWVQAADLPPRTLPQVRSVLARYPDVPA